MGGGAADILWLRHPDAQGRVWATRQVHLRRFGVTHPVQLATIPRQVALHESCTFCAHPTKHQSEAMSLGSTEIHYE